MIGLYDMDLYNSKSLIPNLEIMKLARYYEKEEGQFCRLLLPDEKSFDGYSKIFVCSEDVNHPPVPLELRRSGNIVAHGAGFSNGKYMPFENKLIENTLPSINIYKEYLSNLLRNNEITPKQVNLFLDSNYVRIYANNRRLPIQYLNRKKPVYIYDSDLSVNEIESICAEFLYKRPLKICTIHPTFCNTVTQFNTLRNIPKFSRKNQIILDIDVPSDEFDVLFNKFTLLFRAEVAKNSNIYLPIGGDYINKIQFYRDFDYHMNLLFSFWAKGIPMKLYYINSNTGINTIETLERTIVKWCDSAKNISIKDYIKEMRPADMREASNKCIEELINYDANLERIFTYPKQGIWRV